MNESEKGTSELGGKMNADGELRNRDQISGEVMNVQSSEKKKRTNQSGAPCTLATCAGNCRVSVPSYILVHPVTCRFAP